MIVLLLCIFLICLIFGLACLIEYIIGKKEYEIELKAMMARYEKYRDIQ